MKVIFASFSRSNFLDCIRTKFESQEYPWRRRRLLWMPRQIKSTIFQHHMETKRKQKSRKVLKIINFLAKLHYNNKKLWLQIIFCSEGCKSNWSNAWPECIAVYLMTTLMRSQKLHILAKELMHCKTQNNDKIVPKNLSLKQNLFVSLFSTSNRVKTTFVNNLNSQGNEPN